MRTAVDYGIAEYCHATYFSLICVQKEPIFLSKICSLLLLKTRPLRKNYLYSNFLKEVSTAIINTNRFQSL